jgi:TRAP-type C4-dicarboxylate transport system permease large subunit
MSVRLLIAGVIPGLILAGFYIATIWLPDENRSIRCAAYDVEPMSGRKLSLLMRDVVPMVGVMVVIMVLMINGFVTPSEAAAFGALGVLILAALFRCLTWDRCASRHRCASGDADGLSDRVRVGHLQPVAGVFRRVPRPGQLGDIGFDLAPSLMLLVMFGVLLMLGMFMEQISIMLLTVPIFFPLALSSASIRSGSASSCCLSLEISFTTPPFGLLLFVMKGVAPPGTTMRRSTPRRFPFILLLAAGRRLAGLVSGLGAYGCQACSGN